MKCFKEGKIFAVGEDNITSVREITCSSLVEWIFQIQNSDIVIINCRISF